MTNANLGMGNRSRLRWLAGMLACGWSVATHAATLMATAHPDPETGLDPSLFLQFAPFVAVAAAVGLLCILIFRKRPGRSQPVAAAGVELAGDRRQHLADEDDMTRIMREFRSGPALSPGLAPAGGVPRITGLESSPAVEPMLATEKGTAQLTEFFAWAPAHLAALQKMITVCRQSEDQRSLRDSLVRVGDEVGTLKHRASLPELRPAWQLATALEGLLKQLSARAGNINHSTLRTIAGAQDLLGELCAAGVRADLAVNPPIRILAVDDEPVSRFALESSLKKAFDRPDIAESARTALTQVRRQRYDLIILDVMMPEMDGFELCGRIRESTSNASTPVLFVTSLQDFDSRTKALSTGGSDLVGKPFITFEMTVKALTLVLRGRLQSRVGGAELAASASISAAVRWPDQQPVAESEESPIPKAGLVVDQKESADEKEPGASSFMPPAPLSSVSAARLSAGTICRELNPEFVRFMEAFGPEMQKKAAVIGQTEDLAARKELLLRLHLRLQTLSRKIQVPELRPAYEVCCALEGLARKLRDDATKATPSALRTLAIGLELLKDLCVPGVSPTLISQPPIRLLVVDDEPLARRALSGALQLGFGRPEGADGAETALALIGAHEFDLIFLDVCMPEMDGFTVCGKIHETQTNRTTPVVFVTSHSGEEFRTRADQCGGKDFVVKPFDFMEIPVKALTYALRGRLEKSKQPGTTAVGTAVASGSKNP